MTAIERAQTLNQGQFSRLVKITQATSRYFERDVLVLMLGHHCGMRVTEISRITLPHQPLIYSSRGAGLSQNTKRRVLDTGQKKDYKACDLLQAHLTRLYKKAGINGSSHSGRRTFAGKVLASTGDMGTVATLLGHSSISCSARYVDVNPAILCEMFSNAI